MVIDFSESTEIILQNAKELAKKLSAQVPLLHIAEPEPDFVGLEVGPQGERDFLAKRFHNEHLQNQEFADRFRSVGLDTTAIVVQGATVETILKEASKLDVDMIILGSHGRGMMYQLLVGSVCEGVLQKSECPILVIPTHERT